MPKVTVEEKTISITTKVFSCEFTQDEADALIVSLERSVGSYSARRGAPTTARLQREILKALTGLSVVSDDSELEEEEDDA